MLVTRTAVGLALAVVVAACPGDVDPEPVDIASRVDAAGTEVAAGIIGCRAVLDCALLCDAPGCREECLADAGAPSDGAAAVLDCLDQRCAASAAGLGRCAVAECFDAVQACYFEGQRGAASCGETWTCFGDCGDHGACLGGCRAAASLEAQRRFYAVELCSDAWVVTECRSPGDVCDLEAMHGPCAAELGECVAHEQPPATPQTEQACAALAGRAAWPARVSCVDDTRAALAGCPTADKEALRAVQACVIGVGCAGDPASSCGPWTPSSLCLEVLGPAWEAGAWP